MDKSHSERNAHRLFNRYGLSLRVRISFLEVAGSSEQPGLSIPYLKVTDFLSHLLNKYEEVLFGGLPLAKGEELCATFWSRFQSYNPDHVVYSTLKEEDRCRCVPILIHGDKGRTLQKSPIFLLSFEVPWGLPPDMLSRCAYDNRCNAKRQFRDGKLSWTCKERAKASGKRSFDEVQFDACTMKCPKQNLDPSCNGCHQRHNGKGHSFLSRFMIAAITSKVYSQNTNVLPGLLKEVAKQLREAFEQGLQHVASGSNVKFAFVGCKGDAEFHWEAANFTRSYHKTSTKSNLMICPLCEAGAEGISFTDMSDEPSWLSTLGSSDPWHTQPPLNEAPFANRFPANLYKFDPFHVLNPDDPKVFN